MSFHPPRPRFSIRGFMIALAIGTIGLWAIGTAVSVAFDRGTEWIYHRWERHVAEGYHAPFLTQHSISFWPRYWRKLLGLSWPGSYDCGCKASSTSRYAKLVSSSTGPNIRLAALRAPRRVPAIPRLAPSAAPSRTQIRVLSADGELPSPSAPD
jgi:hypothetical protein